MVDSLLTQIPRFNLRLLKKTFLKNNTQNAVCNVIPMVFASSKSFLFTKASIKVESLTSGHLDDSLIAHMSLSKVLTMSSNNVVTL